MYRNRDGIPLCLSCLGIPFRHSRNTANLRVFCVRGIMILLSRLKRIQRHSERHTRHSECSLDGIGIGTSKQTATIRPTEQEHPTRTPERAWIMYRNRDGIPLYHSEKGQRTPDSTPYFVGKDVAEILGYSNTAKAIINHVDEEDKLIFQTSQNGNLETSNRGMYVINESGLYSLILSSKLPKAKEFKLLYLREYQREQAAQKRAG